MEHIPDKMEEPTTYDDDEDHDHFLTKPMFEVFSITIHSNNENPTKSLRDGKPCHIRGIVRVIDEGGKVYDLYNRQSDNAEIITLGGSIPLTNFSIVPFKTLKVTILLYDVAHDIEFANGVFHLDYSKSYDYNNVHMARVDGEHGFASVHHSTFQHAVIACIKHVELCKNVGPNPLFGTVVARLERTQGLILPGDVNKHEYPTTILFDNRQYSKSEQSMYVQAQFNTPIKLFRSWLAVPVDCSLVIEADFCDETGVKFTSTIQRKASPNGCTLNSQNGEMSVKGYWYHVYPKYPRETKVKDSEVPFLEEDFASNMSSESEVSSNTSDAEQPLMVSDEETTSNSNTELSSEAQQPSSISWSYLHASRPCLFSFVEVFSVLIHVDGNDSDISGTIKASDCNWNKCYIFNGKEKCCGEKTLSILGPPWSFRDEFFNIHVNLKDEKGRVISKGFLEWFYANNSGPFSYYDRHMCSLIQGDIGYSVIHYSMFTYSLQAMIRVCLLSHTIPSSFFVNVFGRITGEYSNYEYPTPYDQEFYKSTIFYKPKSDSVRVGLESGSTLPLLKYIMSVPVENSLILDVNLNVSGPFEDYCGKGMNVDLNKQTQEYLVISKLVEFNSNVEGYCVFERGDYVISICVEWGTYMIPPEEFSLPILPDKRSLDKAMQKVSLNA